jgi:hypothetical protein
VPITFVASTSPNHNFSKSHFWQIYLARSSKRKLRNAQFPQTLLQCLNPSSSGVDKDCNLTSLALAHSIAKKPSEHYQEHHTANDLSMRWNEGLVL